MSCNFELDMRIAIMAATINPITSMNLSLNSETIIDEMKKEGQEEKKKVLKKKQVKVVKHDVPSSTAIVAAAVAAATTASLIALFSSEFLCHVPMCLRK